MERTGPMVLTAFLCVALLAASCSGDDGGDESGEFGSSPIDEALGAQAVQDFTIHLGLWVLGDDGEPIGVSDDLLAELMPGAGAEIALDGGFTVAPVDDLEARMVDPSGTPLPSVSVDLGVLVPTESVVDELPGDPAHAPLLVEIVTAEYTAVRDHVAPGDRSELDVTFLDGVEPGDAAAVLHVFGQTFPGEPSAEAGLDPLALFAQRWNEGHVRLLGDGGFPRPLVDATVQLNEGSTVLSRESKGELARIIALSSALGSNQEVVREMDDDIFLNQVSANPGTDSEAVVSRARVPLPFTDEQLVVQCGGMQGSLESCGVFFPDGTFIPPNRLSRSQARSVVRVYRNFVACTAAAAVLAANNEAGRRPVPNVLDRFPTTRFVAEGSEEPSPSSTDTVEPDEGPPPLGCEDPPEPDPSGGGVHGDVRVTTIDGITYGQQAVGEFVVFENDTSVVQMRAEPAGDSDRLSLATGFAVGTGGHSIAMHRGARTYVDGELRVLERGDRVAVGDAEVLRGAFGDWTLVWPDGQQVVVFDRGDANGMTLTVRPGPGPRAGQLGNGNGDPDDDFATRDGQVLEADVTEDFDRFYGTYVDSWRIGDDESLLHREDGETAASFLVDGFPSDAVTVEDLDPAAVREAERVCAEASLTNDALLSGCVIDVAVTGDEGYAFDAFRVQVGSGHSGASAPATSDDAVEVTPTASGDTVLALGGAAFVYGEDPPGQRPGGVAPTWSCEILDGDLFAEGSIDLADGPRYSLSVRYLAADSRLSLILRRTTDEGSNDHAWVVTDVAHFADAVDEAALDGSHLRASGDIYVNDPPQLGLAPFSQLPAGASLDPFTLDLSCAS